MTDDPTKGLDLGAIPFLVDRLTMKDVRRTCPELFGVGGLRIRYPLFSAASLEQEIARRAYLSGKGRDAYSEGVDAGVVDLMVTDKELFEMLHETYEKCGLTASPEETRAAYAAIRAAARQQAGRPPRPPRGNWSR